MFVRDEDQIIIEGENDPPIVWQFLKNDIADDAQPTPQDLFDLTGSTLYLTIYRGTTVIVDINTDDDAELVINTIDSTLTWTPPLATTRALPRGRIAKYEVERRVGLSQGRLIAGSIVVLEGRNDD
jgi:hypothetical protein